MCVCVRKRERDLGGGEPMVTSGILNCTIVWIVVPLPKIGRSGRRPGLGENLMDFNFEKC